MILDFWFKIVEIGDQVLDSPVRICTEIPGNKFYCFSPNEVQNGIRECPAGTRRKVSI